MTVLMIVVAFLLGMGVQYRIVGPTRLNRLALSDRRFTGKIDVHYLYPEVRHRTVEGMTIIESCFVDEGLIVLRNQPYSPKLLCLRISPTSPDSGNKSVDSIELWYGGGCIGMRLIAEEDYSSVIVKWTIGCLARASQPPVFRERLEQVIGDQSVNPTSFALEPPRETRG